ncbi:MAG: cupin domain-containing protein [Acidimicrobiales bacterium]|jgi:quercetin dioxygenase-like cupin family protein
MSLATKTPIQLHALTVTFLLDEVDTHGAATVFEIRVPADAFVPPPHSHDGFEESVYVLEGVFTFVIDGVGKELGPGQAGFVGRGQVHSFDNTGDTDGVFLSVATPGIFRRDYFEEIAEVLAASPDGPPDLNALFLVMASHGLTPAIPSAPAAAG